MWWLIGIIAAVAAASRDEAPDSRMGRVARPLERPFRSVTYRSRDGRQFFRFRLTPIGHGIRIHIVEFPNPRLGSCHVLQDHTGPYICWSGPVTSEGAAKRVASIWAEATLDYQRSGRVF